MPATRTEFCLHLQRRPRALLAEELGPTTHRPGQVSNRYSTHGRAARSHAFVAKTVYQFAAAGAFLEALKWPPHVGRLCGRDTTDLPGPAVL